MYSSDNSNDSITLKVFTLYKYHAEQTNYKTKNNQTSGNQLDLPYFP